MRVQDDIDKWVVFIDECLYSHYHNRFYSNDKVFRVTFKEIHSLGLLRELDKFLLVYLDMNPGSYDQIAEELRIAEVPSKYLAGYTVEYDDNYLDQDIANFEVVGSNYTTISLDVTEGSLHDVIYAI